MICIDVQFKIPMLSGNMIIAANGRDECQFLGIGLLVYGSPYTVSTSVPLESRVQYLSRIVLSSRILKALLSLSHITSLMSVFKAGWFCPSNRFSIQAGASEAAGLASEIVMVRSVAAP